MLALHSILDGPNDLVFQLPENEYQLEMMMKCLRVIAEVMAGDSDQVINLFIENGILPRYHALILSGNLAIV